MRKLYRISAPITKIDEETRTIEGAATVETTDAHGEVVDYATAKGIIAGTWPGNLREMHQLIAAGTGAVIECDDATKTVRVRGHVSKGAPLTWEKVKDGTLKAFSIGGEAAKRVSEKAADGTARVRLFLKNVHEISLVDNPACPGCGFDVVNVTKGVAALVGDDVAIVTKRAISQAERDKIPQTDCAGPNKSYPIAEAGDVKDAADALGRAKGGAPARAKVKARIISIAYRKGDSFVAQLPEAWKKKADQTAEKAVALVAAWPKIQKAEGEALSPMDLECEPGDIDRAARIIADLNWLLCSEMYGARAAALEGDAAGAAGEMAQIGMLRNAIEEVIDFLEAEFAEQFGEDVALDEDDEEDDESDDAATAPLVTMGRRILMFSNLATLLDGARVTKAGAEFSKKNKQKIQAIHDHTADMGAECAAPEDDAAKVAKAAAAAATPAVELAPCGQCTDATRASCAVCGGSGQVAKATAVPGLQVAIKVADLPEVVKAIDDARKALEAVTTENATLKTTATAQAATIGQLTTRLEALESKPAAGGPVVRVAEKTIGGPAAPGDGGTSKLTPDQLEDVIKQMQEGAAKDVLLAELLKVRTAEGLGITRIS